MNRRVIKNLKKANSFLLLRSIVIGKIKQTKKCEEINSFLITMNNGKLRKRMESKTKFTEIKIYDKSGL